MARVEVEAPVAGVVWKVVAAPGTAVRTGDVVLILESMKMEIPVEAPIDGVVAEILVAEGDQVSEDDVIALVDGDLVDGD